MSSSLVGYPSYVIRRVPWTRTGATRLGFSLRSLYCADSPVVRMCPTHQCDCPLHVHCACLNFLAQQWLGGDPIPHLGVPFLSPIPLPFSLMPFPITQ